MRHLLAVLLIVSSALAVCPPVRVEAATTDTFTATGSWVCPAGVISATVECWGGGGAGGGATGNPSAGGGGAGGQYVIKVVSVTPTTSYTVTVGAAVTGSTTATVNGNDSWFNTSGTVIAKGGAGAATTTTTGTGASGSTASGIGDTVNAGGNGGTAPGTGTSGGGGEGGRSTGTGGSASGATAGTGGDGGDGGAGLTTGNLAGNPGVAPGGAGSGGRAGTNTDRAGGDGARGEVRVTYTLPPGGNRRIIIMAHERRVKELFNEEVV